MSKNKYYIDLHPDITKKNIKHNFNYLFISHISFEDRSLGLLELPIEILNRIKKSVFIRATEFLNNKKYVANEKKMTDYIINHTSKKPTLIDADLTDPMSIIIKVAKFFESQKTNDLKCLIDITTFPKDRLISIANYLLSTGLNKHIEFTYSTPINYSTEIENGWLTKGVKQIRAIPKFNGIKYIGNKTLLVIIMGHEIERPNITIKEAEASKLILIRNKKNVDTVIESHKHIENRFVTERLLGIESSQIIASYEIEMLKVNELQKVIFEINELYSSDYNIVISLYGTKIQALETMLSCQILKNIEIRYSYAHEFNVENFSTGISKTYYGIIQKISK